MEENRDTFQNEIEIDYQIDGKEERGNLLNKCWSSLSQSCIGRVIRRFIPLILAVWHQVDIGLDVNQSITYYQMSYDNNSLYQSWAQKHKNETNETIQHTVSSGYFYVAIIVWIFPPGIIALFLLNSYRFCLCSCKNMISDWICPFPILLIKIILLPVGTILIFLFIYLIFPFLLLLFAICKLIVGEKFIENCNCCNFSEFIFQNMAFVEILGESLPQFMLNVVFICNNYEYLLANDLYLRFPVPVSIISCVFSLGSLLMGFNSFYQNFKNMNSRAFKRICC